MSFSYRLVGVVGACAIVALLIIIAVGKVGTGAPVADVVPATPSTSPTTSQIAMPYVPQSAPAAVTTTNVPDMTETPGPSSVSTPQPRQVFLPVVGNGGGEIAPTPTPPAAPPTTPEATGTPPPTSTPVVTRGPIRITKLGLGVYASGGGMLGVLDQARPSVILLMDPTDEFAREVRKRFPKAFIVGRVFVADQPLDNPTQRGTDFAERVAGLAAPLKGVVDAWVSYNEVGSPTDPSTMVNYNLFQVAFAHRLQDVYGIAAVAGNDGPRSVPAELYPRYYADAIRVSRYFGFHSYPDPQIKSLRDPSAVDQVFYYRKIHAALAAAGIKSGPFIGTEIGLYNGWRGVVDDTDMANDFTWVADQMNNDPYVLGMTIFGVFNSDHWANFEVSGSNIPNIAGDYNSVH